MRSEGRGNVESASRGTRLLTDTETVAHARVSRESPNVAAFLGMRRRGDVESIAPSREASEAAVPRIETLPAYFGPNSLPKVRELCPFSTRCSSVLPSGQRTLTVTGPAAGPRPKKSTG